MTKEKKKDNVKYMDVEINISMHCNECERKIARVISKFKGVETFVTDMNSHKVVVTGKIDPKKLLKKLKKKTGKRAKIVVKEEKDEESSKDAEDENVLEIDMEPIGLGDEWYNNDREMEKFMVFSDENPKAIICSIS
ncbi:PREDICTED: heavy metal-associated isoprenylated plant protein 3-like [Camelina sativa]|uniref:Heavy metal-associated isoprenylated plant protein 3-like n=1 Tax=Camelina sativa TaxID=90675 RepID=A0ABM0W6I5_CAMSA|nr:PREDICTED: heavy metal-associated isoprenylated plant protein 3-like [Camelina sativa]